MLTLLLATGRQVVVVGLLALPLLLPLLLMCLPTRAAVYLHSASVQMLI